MIQVCMDCNIIYGEKEPYEDKSYTHGLCPKCFKVRLEELEERRELKKVERRLINMPIKKPREGDFVLWEDDIWVITKVKSREVIIAMLGKHGYEDEDHILTDTLEPTSIKTWEVE